MSRITALLLMALALMIIGPASVSANSDPHRFALPPDPFDVEASYCGFPVRVEFLVDRAYGRDQLQADGSEVVDITGAAVVRLSTIDGERSLVLNASGPASFTYRLDGTAVQFSRGRGLLFAANLASDFGFPSNFVVLAGEVVIEWPAAGNAVGSMSGNPHVVTDVCAALS